MSCFRHNGGNRNCSDCRRNDLVDSLKEKEKVLDLALRLPKVDQKYLIDNLIQSLKGR